MHVLVFSQPERRYNHSVAMVPELLRVGGTLHGELARSDARVAVVISADLAHTHLASGPCGFSKAHRSHIAPLLETAARYAQDALSCGYTGIVMLEGLLAAAARAGNAFVVEQVEGPYHPTYYGMLVALFLPVAMR